MMKGRFATAGEAWEKAAAHAAAAGDRREELEHLAWVPIVEWCGPGTVEEGVRRFTEIQTLLKQISRANQDLLEERKKR